MILFVKWVLFHISHAQTRSAMGKLNDSPMSLAAGYGSRVRNLLVTFALLNQTLQNPSKNSRELFLFLLREMRAFI